MIKHYLARRDTRWDVYQQEQPLVRVTVERRGAFSVVRGPLGNELQGMILDREIAAPDEDDLPPDSERTQRADHDLDEAKEARLRGWDRE